MMTSAEDPHRGIADFIADLAVNCSAAQSAITANIRADRAEFLSRARRLPPQLREIVAPCAPPYQLIAKFEVEARVDVLQSRSLRGRLDLQPLNAYYTRAKRSDVSSASRISIEIQYNTPDTTGE